MVLDENYKGELAALVLPLSVSLCVCSVCIEYIHIGVELICFRIARVEKFTQVSKICNNKNTSDQVQTCGNIAILICESK